MMNKERISISQLKEGQNIHKPFIIDNIRPSMTKYGSPCFRADLKDASGMIQAVCWDVDGSITSAQNGEIVEVIGKVGNYNGQAQIVVESLSFVDPADINEDSLPELILPAPIDVEEYKKDLSSFLNSFQDVDVHNICAFVFFCYGEAFESYPAAKSIHHAFKHGLLMHSVDMAKMADSLADLKPGSFNRDLLIAGALLHDIGKVVEFEISSVTGLVTGYSDTGNLIGHSVIGAQMIEEAAGVVGARSEVVELLKHMVLAHHGEPNCGSARVPMTIEAELLHKLDSLDSRRRIYEESIAQTPKGEYSGKIYALGHAIYHHEVVCF